MRIPERFPDKQFRSRRARHMHFRPRKLWLFCLATVLAVLAVPAIGELQRLPNWHSVCALQFSPDGQVLVAGLYDGRAYNEDFHYRLADMGQTIALFDSHTGKRSDNLAQFRYPGPFSGIPSTPLGRFLAFSPDGSLLAIATWDGTVQLWDWRTRRLNQTLRSQTEYMRAVAFSSGGRYLLAGGRSGSWLWDTQGSVAGSFVDATGSATKIAGAPNSNLLAIADRHSPWVELLNCDSGTKTRVEPGKSYGALSISFSPNGRSLAIGGTESVLIWNLDDHAKQFEVASHWTQDLAFSPDGKVLTAAGADGVRSWNVDTGEPNQVVPYQQHASSLAYSADGTLLAVGGYAGEIAVWQVATKRLLWSGGVTGPSRGFHPFTVAAGITLIILAVLAIWRTAGPPDSARSPAPTSGSE
ncbi:MAG: WD40 repeat domain-containing protein [Deltaproteobacteria bacterium]